MTTKATTEVMQAVSDHISPPGATYYDACGNMQLVLAGAFISICDKRFISTKRKAAVAEERVF